MTSGYTGTIHNEFLECYGLCRYWSILTSVTLLASVTTGYTEIIPNKFLECCGLHPYWSILTVILLKFPPAAEIGLVKLWQLWASRLVNKKTDSTHARCILSATYIHAGKFCCLIMHVSNWVVVFNFLSLCSSDLWGAILGSGKKHLHPKSQWWENFQRDREISGLRCNKHEGVCQTSSMWSARNQTGLNPHSLSHNYIKFEVVLDRCKLVYRSKTKHRAFLKNN